MTASPGVLQRHSALPSQKMEFTTAKDHATSHADLDAPNNLITLGEPDVPKYRHESLPEKGDWIRVLQLYATRSRIECALTQIRHTDGNYQALSYVWGSQDTQYKAFVVDQSSGATIGFISLTTNLRNALHNLRDCADIADKVFWIDQICINQESTDEKNYQVLMALVRCACGFRLLQFYTRTILIRIPSANVE